MQRCSSLERPLSSTGARNSNVQTPRQCPSPLPAHITKGKDGEKCLELVIVNNITDRFFNTRNYVSI